MSHLHKLQHDCIIQQEQGRSNNGTCRSDDDGHACGDTELAALGRVYIDNCRNEASNAV